jgi:hypothetical protein
MVIIVSYKKHFISELIINLLIILLLFLFIRSSVISSTSNFSSRVFPNINSPFSIFKLFFLTISIKGVFEYFIISDYPRNFFFSRVVSLVIMILSSLLFYSLFYFLIKYMSLEIYVIFIVFYPITIAQAISFRIQRMKQISINYSLASFNYFLLMLILMMGVFLPQTGFIFEAVF